jgi:hypothetical protein
MEHFELHLLTSEADIADAELAGLLDPEEKPQCENCGEVVGSDLDEFYPFVVVLSADEVWFVCDECYTPILDPQGF